jgi:MoaA/NifB/PqqE/SkfB family radical SAM enzyme
MFAKFKRLCESRLLSLLGYAMASFIPAVRRLEKYRNILIAAYCVNRGMIWARNNPIRVRLAPIATCNFRCLFCEIHRDNLLFPDRKPNAVTMKTIDNYATFLASAYTLSFFGGTAEPLLSRQFGAIVERLKSRYGIRMSVNTNASPLTPALSDILVNHGFDSMLISYHAGTLEGYRTLMTGKLEAVNRNISYLTQKKMEMGTAKPELVFNYAPQKRNADEYKAIFDNAKGLGVDRVFVSRYHGGRNALQDEDVDFEDDPEAGNAFLERAYAYAEEIGLPLTPVEPRYFKETSEVAWDAEDYDRSIKCYQPWTDLYLEPVLNAENSHYVRVCNRTTLFQMDFEKLDLSTQAGFDRVWNHPMMQYLRETVNSDAINPLCKYCKNPARREVRNRDHASYAILRDDVMAAFVEEFRAACPDFAEVDGLIVLDGHPYDEREYLRRTSGEAAPTPKPEAIKATS